MAMWQRVSDTPRVGDAILIPIIVRLAPHVCDDLGTERLSVLDRDLELQG